MPNQDAYHDFVDAEAGFAILAVADGHGSQLCPQSHVGSQLAVDVAIATLRETVAQLLNRFDFSGPWTKDLRLNSAVASLKTELPQELVSAWRSRVDEQRALLEVTEQGYLPFGTTLLAAAVTGNFAIVLQIGDGDTLAVDSANQVSRPIICNDPKIGDETKSMCLDRAEQYMQLEFMRFASNMARPKAIYLSTDGFSNAFKDSDSFEQSVIDFTRLLDSTEGRSSVDTNLDEWLQEYATFSGDDVTLGMLFDQSQCSS